MTQGHFRGCFAFIICHVFISNGAHANVSRWTPGGHLRRYILVNNTKNSERVQFAIVTERIRSACMTPIELFDKKLFCLPRSRFLSIEHLNKSSELFDKRRLKLGTVKCDRNRSKSPCSANNPAFAM